MRELGWSLLIGSVAKAEPPTGRSPPDEKQCNGDLASGQAATEEVGATWSGSRPCAASAGDPGLVGDPWQYQRDGAAMPRKPQFGEAVEGTL